MQKGDPPVMLTAIKLSKPQTMTVPCPSFAPFSPDLSSSAAVMTAAAMMLMTRHFGRDSTRTVTRPRGEEDELGVMMVPPTPKLLSLY